MGNIVDRALGQSEVAQIVFYDAIRGSAGSCAAAFHEISGVETDARVLRHESRRPSKPRQRASRGAAGRCWNDGQISALPDSAANLKAGKEIATRTAQHDHGIPHRARLAHE